MASNSQLHPSAIDLHTRLETANGAGRSSLSPGGIGTGSKAIMSMATLVHRNVRPIRHDPTPHLFAVGQTVRLKRNFGMYPSTNTEIYHVTGTMPPNADSPQYRIRNDDERHERVVTQDNLESVDLQPEDNLTLIERTFGNGKGTETQQSGNSKTEAGKSFAKG
jgi:hypothetical protein